GRLHQARALEIADDGRHRRRAEARAARQVGARDLALLPDEVEKERRVARAHPLRVDGDRFVGLAHAHLLPPTRAVEIDAEAPAAGDPPEAAAPGSRVGGADAERV